MHRLEFNSRVVHALYTEAHVLMQEARHAFADHLAQAAPLADDIKALIQREEENAIICLTHALAWLRNQQSYWEGQQSLFRLRLRRLPRTPAEPHSADLDHLPEAVHRVSRSITRFYQRLQDLENHWHPRTSLLSGALARLLSRNA